MSAPDAIEGLLSNPGLQCTLFPFLGVLSDAPDAPACWDLWYNNLFVHNFVSQLDDGTYASPRDKWDKAPGIDPYVFGYVGLAFAISLSVCGAAW